MIRINSERKSLRIEETNYCLNIDINVKFILYYITLLTKCNSVYSISCSYLL
jgi:hypothetical protein